MSNLDVPIFWTQFFSAAAQRKAEHRESLRQIEARVKKAKNPDKHKLPWLKFAKFGEKRSDKGSYRTNANLIYVTGCEADYDGGTFPPERVASILTKNNICGLVYTTPSHKQNMARWRVALPFSPGEHDPSKRAECLSWLNGRDLLFSILEPESFTLSLSYFYGSTGTPIQTWLVDGDFIDLRPDLAQGAVGKRGEDLIGIPRASSGKKVDLSDEDFEALVMRLDNHEDAFADRGAWRDVGFAINHQLGEDGFRIFDEWSKQWGGYDGDYTRATWETMGATEGAQKTGAFILMLGKSKGVWEQPRPSADGFDVVTEPEGEPPAHLRPKVVTVTNEDEELIGPAEDDPIGQMNKHHAVVEIGNKVRILEEKPGGGVVILPQTDFELLFKNKRIPAGPRSTVSLASYWLEHERRRTFHNGLVFKPAGKAPHSTYNLFRGFSAKPNGSGSCTLFLDHLFENVCRGIDAHFHYLVSWMADLIQHPDIKPGVATVLRGRKGAGKDIVARSLGLLFKPNYVNIKQIDHLTGKFNAHMELALLLHVEEGYWAGDKKAEGILKGLITSETVALERKGVDVIQIDSVCRLMITSNEKWVVPATPDERRFFVLEVSDAHRADRKYFGPIIKQLQDGGYGKLLDTLQTWDLNGFDIGDVPDTEGLSGQKVASLKGAPLWWQSILESGELPVENDFVGEGWLTSYVTSPISTFYDAYADWWTKHARFGHGDLMSKADLGRVIAEMCPLRTKVQRGPLAARWTAHRFPSLPTCREQFDRYLGSPVTWPEEPEDDLIG